MATLLRLGGISLIIGTLVLSVGSYASFRGVQVEKLEELVPGIAGSAQVSAGWVSLAPGVGIALMALGLLAAVAVLVILMRAKLSNMGRDSMRHFDTTLATIRELGGTPSWGFGFELDKDESDLRQTLLNQIDKEKLAKMGHQRAAELTSEEDLRQRLLKMAADEEDHIRLVEQALALL